MIEHVYSKFGATQVTLLDENQENIVKSMIADGEMMVADDRRCPDSAKALLTEFKSSEKNAMRAHRAIWRYGDMREDTAPEFGSLK